MEQSKIIDTLETYHDSAEGSSLPEGEIIVIIITIIDSPGHSNVGAIGPGIFYFWSIYPGRGSWNRGVGRRLNR